MSVPCVWLNVHYPVGLKGVKMKMKPHRIYLCNACIVACVRSRLRKAFKCRQTWRQLKFTEIKKASEASVFVEEHGCIKGDSSAKDVCFHSTSRTQTRITRTTWKISISKLRACESTAAVRDWLQKRKVTCMSSVFSLSVGRGFRCVRETERGWEQQSWQCTRGSVYWRDQNREPSPGSEKDGSVRGNSSNPRRTQTNKNKTRHIFTYC